MNLWTVLASLLCSLSLSDAAFQVQQQVRLAAVGSPAAIGRLSDVAARMAGSEAAVTVDPLPARPVLVKLTPPSSYRDDVAALMNWVGTQGRNSTFQGQVAKLFEYNDTGVDIPCLRKAFEDDQTHVVYAFYMIPVGAGRKNVMVRKTPALSLIWEVADDGRIERAAEYSDPHSGFIPKDKYGAYWLETKDYLLGEMHKASGIAQDSARPKS